MSHFPAKLGPVNTDGPRHGFSPGHVRCRKEQPLCIALGFNDTVYAADDADVTCIGCRDVLAMPVCPQCRGKGINLTSLLRITLCPACDGRGRRSR